MLHHEIEIDQALRAQPVVTLIYDYEECCFEIDERFATIRDAKEYLEERSLLCSPIEIRWPTCLVCEQKSGDGETIRSYHDIRWGLFGPSIGDPWRPLHPAMDVSDDLLLAKRGFGEASGASVLHPTARDYVAAALAKLAMEIEETHTAVLAGDLFDVGNCPLVANGLLPARYHGFYTGFFFGRLRLHLDRVIYGLASSADWRTGSLAETLLLFMVVELANRFYALDLEQDDELALWLTIATNNEPFLPLELIAFDDSAYRLWTGDYAGDYDCEDDLYCDWFLPYDAQEELLI